MSTYLVIGATGRQGGQTARDLLAAGVTVRALVRSPNSSAAKAIESQGAILFQGDVADTAAVTGALEGVTGVFFNPPYPAEDTLQITQKFIAICKEAGIETFVLSSTVGADRHAARVASDPGFGERVNRFKPYWDLKIGTEKAAREAGFKNLVVLRASLLYHIYLPGDSEALFPALWKERKLTTALKPETSVPHLLAEDVGRFAAKALLEPSKFAGNELDLAAENLTVGQIAGFMGEVAGTEIWATVPRFDDGGVQGVGEGMEYPLVGYHEWCNEVDTTVDTKSLEEYGVSLTTMRQFLEQHKEDIRKAVGN